MLLQGVAAIFLWQIGPWAMPECLLTTDCDRWAFAQNSRSS